LIADERLLLDDIAVAAREAGEAILELVRRGFEVERNQDLSPVKEADRAAE
jgi:3'(2'), 5'-bisphosphate nucleotidase